MLSQFHQNNIQKIMSVNNAIWDSIMLIWMCVYKHVFIIVYINDTMLINRIRAVQNLVRVESGDLYKMASLMLQGAEMIQNVYIMMILKNI